MGVSGYRRDKIYRVCQFSSLPMSACDFWTKDNKNKAKKMSRKEYGHNYFAFKSYVCFEISLRLLQESL